MSTDNRNAVDHKAQRETGLIDPRQISFPLAASKPIVPDPRAGKFTLNYDPQYLRLWDSQDKGTSILPYYDWTGTLTGNAYSGEDTIWLEGFDRGISNLSVAWVEDGYDDGMVFDGSSACTCMCQVIVHGGNAQITTWGVDIDTDSNNNGEIGDYDQNGIYEDDIERTSAKRIFVNIDDDNRNGIPDKDELSDPTFVSDNDLAKTVLQNPVLDDYTDKKVRLTLDGDIRAWNALATSESSGVYEWVLDGVTMVSPGITVPTHSLFPLNIYIEGLEVGSASAKLELLDGGVPVGPPDEVKYSVEAIVWSFSDAPADYEAQNTSDWIGIKLVDGWYISKPLIDYISNPDDKGTISTIHPDSTVRAFEMATASVGGDHNGVSTASYNGDATLEFDYTFDRRGLNPFGYVQTFHQSNDDDQKNNFGDRVKLSFVSNSGIKFGVVPPTTDPEAKGEAAILDVSQVIAVGGGIGNFTLDTNASFGPKGISDSGIVDVINPTVLGGVYDFGDEPLSRLMSGVIYGSDYSMMQDFPLLDVSSATSSDFVDTLTANAAHQNLTNTMRIVIATNAENTKSLTITINGELTYFNPESDLRFGQFQVQSHWGSGVAFSNMRVIE